jgi:hypothetical protein
VLDKRSTNSHINLKSTISHRNFKITSTQYIWVHNYIWHLHFSYSLWSSGQSSWLQIRRPGFDSRHYQKKKVMGLERGPLSLVSTTEQLLDRKSSGSCLENREYRRRDPSRWPRGTLYPQKLVITSPTSGGRSVGIVRSRTQTKEFSFMSLQYDVGLVVPVRCSFTRTLNVEVYTTTLSAGWILSG